MKKQSYKIIIPSFRRADIIKTHTLKALANTDASKDIYVFVADKKDQIDYSISLHGFSNIKIIQGVRGIPNQRNFIQKYFPVGDHLLFIDDDIETIVGLNQQGKRVGVTKLDAFIRRAFEMTAKTGLKMFGINSTNSNLEMKQVVSVGRIYLVGNFYGLINIHDCFVDEGDIIPKRRTFEAGKESHERALMMYKKFGGVLKYRAFGVVSKYWGVIGGHQVTRNNDGEKQASIILHSMYPHITQIRIHKGFYDLKIKTSTKTFATAFYQ